MYTDTLIYWLSFPTSFPAPPLPMFLLPTSLPLSEPPMLRLPTRLPFAPPPLLDLPTYKQSMDDVDGNIIRHTVYKAACCYVDTDLITNYTTQPEHTTTITMAHSHIRYLLHMVRYFHTLRHFTTHLLIFSRHGCRL